MTCYNGTIKDYSKAVTKIRGGFLFAMTEERIEFYESRKWKRKRQQILKRDGYMCQICKRYGRIREAQEVHHIQHLEDRPDLALDNNNLISLCRACHNAQHPEKGRDRRR